MNIGTSNINRKYETSAILITNIIISTIIVISAT